ncbi:WAT1-related protein [Citrus sinensis]|uniref:WAT1-related protein n=1 Tax=Citrus sinensis TaxID=2711 RepID=A0ACB8LJ14_CITSI|nr:WAT1-related protein [Citrus sinensis]
MGKVGLAPVIGMMMAECAQVGLMFAAKAAMSNGMSNLVFVFYSNAFASLVLLPASLLFHRSQIPPLTLPVLSAFFLLGFLGMEKLDWKSSSSLAKSVGTIVLITGAFIMTYYKGPHLLMTSSPPNLSLQFFMPQTNWVIGGLLLAIDCVFTSAWLIVQASILEKFSAELIVVFFYCFFVAIQSAILCLVMERDLSSWSLKPGVRLVAVLYSAVFGSAFQVGVCTWCLHRTGPVFVAMFKPLGIVISAAVGTIFLGETVYLGRFIGAAVIVTGFYSVMWGKAKEGNSGVETGKIMFDLFYLRHFQVQLPIIIVVVIGKPEGGQEDYQEYVNASDMKTLFSIVILSQEHGRHHQSVPMSKENALAGTLYTPWRSNPFHILIVRVKAFAKISQQLLMSDVK